MMLCNIVKRCYNKHQSIKRFSSYTNPFTRSKPTNASANANASASANASANANATASKSLPSSYFYRLVRVGRVGLITIAIYKIGYSQGCIDYAKNPNVIQSQLIEMALKTNEAKNYYTPSSDIYKTVEPIFLNIIESARSYVDNKITSNNKRIIEIDKEIKSYRDQELHTIINTLLNEKIVLQSELVEFKDAHIQLSGKWEMCLNDSKLPNAFVNASIPRVIFVNEGLLTTFKPTDDELALILAHEISHMILNHSSNKLLISIGLAASQLIIYTLVDPVGYTSFFMDGLIEKASSLLDKAYSRHCEEDADELGLMILARTCIYDPSKGSLIFKKFNEVSHNHRTSYDQTHPGDMDRYERLTELSMKIKDNGCKSYKNSWGKVTRQSG